MALGWKRTLKSSWLYRRLRASPIHDMYLRVVYPEMIRARQTERLFYESVLDGLDHSSCIYDIGANEGHKAAIFRSLGAKVVCVEPDERNIAHLRWRFASPGSNVTVVPKAASSRVGRLTFNIFDEGSPFNTLSAKWVDTLADLGKSRFSQKLSKSRSCWVQTTTLDHLLDEFGPAFYVKIDVEGHELAVIQGLSRKVKYLSFELNLPEFLEEGLSCVEQLKSIDPDVRFNYAVDPKLESPCWLGVDEFAAWLAKTPLRYMEVYARFSPDTKVTTEGLASNTERSLDNSRPSKA